MRDCQEYPREVSQTKTVTCLPLAFYFVMCVSACVCLCVYGGKCYVEGSLVGKSSSSGSGNHTDMKVEATEVR